MTKETKITLFQNFTKLGTRHVDTHWQLLRSGATWNLQKNKMAVILQCGHQLYFISSYLSLYTT